MPAPSNPSVYHIIHVDRLPSVIADGHLWCDEVMAARQAVGTTIGMTDIKARRMTSQLASRPGLRVGQCVPFYFCPRSVMLFLIDRRNHPNLTYLGGQDPILHLEADLRATVEWAAANGRRWAFTLSNAGAVYFEDRRDLAELGEIDWSAVNATKWSGRGVDPSVKEGKQAEFLVERSFPWELISRIGVRTSGARVQVQQVLQDAVHQPAVEVVPSWYY
jgi:hypothetical protein